MGIDKGEEDAGLANLFVTLRKIAEPFLEQLGLSVAQISSQELPELELSLLTLRSAIQRPDAFGTVNLSVTANASVFVVKSDSARHIEVTILPILLEREQLVIRRIKALEDTHRLHDLDNVVDLVKDNAVRAEMAEKLKVLREKAALYEKEIEVKRPNVFIGSSTEGLAIAEAIQLNLDHACETTLWSQGVFGLSEGTLEALVRAASGFDFAVLVLTPDDLVTKREKSGQQPRDNVLFELGLFMGKLGRDRTFIVHERKTSLDLPTDLAGITPATFGRRADNNMQAALGPVCTQLKTAMRAVKIG